MAGIVLSALAAYGNGFSNAFVYPHLVDIADNPTIRHLWPIGPVLNPPAEGGLTVGGRPMVNPKPGSQLRASGGTQVWGYHAVVNLLIHLAAGLTLFGVIRRTLSGRQIEGPPDLFWPSPSACSGTLHLLQTESVTYVIERAGVADGVILSAHALLLTFGMPTGSEVGRDRWARRLQPMFAPGALRAPGACSATSPLRSGAEAISALSRSVGGLQRARPTFSI